MTPPSLARLTPTLAALLGIEAPALAADPPLPSVMAAAAARLGQARLARCLVFCPDALGAHLSTAWPEDFAVLGDADVRVALHAPFPPVTPVSFASMFTGGSPGGHGIRRYAKPVLACDTLFDAALRGGLRVAIVAVAGSSVATIFRGRALDYFDETYDDAVERRVLALLQEDRHDLIVAYVQAYDDALHATDPFSPRAVAAFRENLAIWSRLRTAMDTAWAAHDRGMVFAPDHGAHVDSEGRGDHGLAIAEDLEVFHYVVLAPGRG